MSVVRAPVEEVFRSRIDQWLGRVLMLALFGIILMTLLVADSIPLWGIVTASLGAGVFMWFTWRYAIRARVVVTADEVRVVNLLRVHHVPANLIEGLEPGSWTERLVLKDGREFNTWGMATAAIEDMTGAAFGRRVLFMQALKRAQRRSRSPGREVLTRWQSEWWVVLAVAGPLAVLMVIDP